MKPGLRYSTDGEPGIARAFQDGVAVYRHPKHRVVREPRTLARIAALAIPPAWTDVWICTNESGHLQATGRDARHRKQYVYHAAWVAERDSNKFDALQSFASVLPRIRRAVRRDLALPELSKERVLAAVVQLMDRSLIRVGGERYRRENGSFGLTTLRNRHVRANGAAVALDFRGKAGVRHQIRIEDERVSRVVRDCLDLPGQVLFQYQTDAGLKSIGAQDVNEYLRRISGSAITSKDFRTWGGTVCAAAHLAKVGPAETKRDERKYLRDAIKAAASMLGNTPAVCKRSYIHPLVLSSYVSRVSPSYRHSPGMRKAESAVLGLLDEATNRSAPRRRRRLSEPTTARPAYA